MIDKDSSPSGNNPLHNNKGGEPSPSSSDSFSSQASTKKPGLVRRFFRQDRQYAIEITLLTFFVIIAFGLSLQRALNSSVQTLVPEGSTSTCDTAPELYVLPEQFVEAKFPVSFKFVSYTDGTTIPGIGVGNVYGKWSSCRKQAYDTESISLTPENQYNITVDESPIRVATTAEKFVSAVNSTDNCFQLTCGYEYFWKNISSTERIKEIISNSLFALIPYTPDDFAVVDNHEILIGNTQVFTSIFVTNRSVEATCILSVDGTVINVLIQSNSVAGTGTYLCTTYASSFQAFSAALSITLTAIGITRLYFKAKKFIQALNKLE